MLVCAQLEGVRERPEERGVVWGEGAEALQDPLGGDGRDACWEGRVFELEELEEVLVRLSCAPRDPIASYESQYKERSLIELTVLRDSSSSSRLRRV